MIVRKNLDHERSGNFAGAESTEDVAAGIISFDNSSLGRQVSEMCLRWVWKFIAVDE